MYYLSEYFTTLDEQHETEEEVSVVVYSDRLNVSPYLCV